MLENIAKLGTLADGGRKRLTALRVPYPCFGCFGRSFQADGCSITLVKVGIAEGVILLHLAGPTTVGTITTLCW